jgi:hypothetical protein
LKEDILCGSTYLTRQFLPYQNLNIKKMKALLFLLLISLVGCTSSNSQSQTKPNNTSLSQSDVKEAISYINGFFDIYKKEGSTKSN